MNRILKGHMQNDRQNVAVKKWLPVAHSAAYKSHRKGSEYVHPNITCKRLSPYKIIKLNANKQISVINTRLAILYCWLKWSFLK